MESGIVKRNRWGLEWLEEQMEEIEAGGACVDAVVIHESSWDRQITEDHSLRPGYLLEGWWPMIGRKDNVRNKTQVEKNEAKTIQKKQTNEVEGFRIEPVCAGSSGLERPGLRPQVDTHGDRAMLADN